MKRYRLKKYDQDLLAFSMDKDNYGQDRLADLCLLADPKELPDGLRPNTDALFSWIKHRLLPLKRIHAKTILRVQHLQPYDWMAQIEACRLLSVNDPYWAAEEGSTESWKGCNLYENAFDENLSLTALTGIPYPLKDLLPGPEMTTNGQLPKMWKRKNGRLHLYKGSAGSSQDSGLVSRSGREPYNEFYASQILHFLGIRHVFYGLQNVEGSLVSVCEAFTSPEISYVPMGHIVHTPYLDDLAEVLQKADAFEDFADLALADALMLNEDRHYGNFGLLKDNETGRWIGLAPLFDHGLSLFAGLGDEAMDDPGQVQDYVQSHSLSAIGVSHRQLVTAFCTRRHRDMLRKMPDFHFVRHPLYNLSEKRIAWIENWLHERAREMLEWIEADKNPDTSNSKAASH